MKHNAVPLLYVKLDTGETQNTVGRLALYERQLYFEYDAAWILAGIEISPFHLPLKAGATRGDVNVFNGLPGVFNDSLPDGWGRLLLDRALRAHHINPDTLTVLDRLAHVGRSGMGALIYEPDYSVASSIDLLDLNLLATEVHEILIGEPSLVIDELLALTGSSAGARPKAMIGVNKNKKSIIHGVSQLPKTHEHWLVKFPNSVDDESSGALEYVYAVMAKAAGIQMMETYLFPAKKGPGYFATKRFDRLSHQRIHIHTAAGLLHSDFRVPALDYEDLIRLTLMLTKNMSEIEKLFRLAVFNVLAHNRDDHGKNFSFLMNGQGEWSLAPAYDLTYSAGPGGEQSTTVMGEGRAPSTIHLMQLARVANIAEKKAKIMIEQCRVALSQWPALAKQAGIRTTKINEVQRAIQT